MIHFFRCKRCGKCCSEIADIDLLPLDIKNMADFLHLDESQVREDSTVPADKPNLRRIKGQPCPFYDSEGEGCKIYPVRPLTCRMYPFLTAGENNQLVNLGYCPSGLEALKEFLSTDLAKELLYSSSKKLQKETFEQALEKMELSSNERRKMCRSIGLK